MRELPIGVQDFVTIRQDDLLYVDKTRCLLELIKNGRRYFLSRPRRFGKSLTLSTLDAMFSGRAELFRGLSAEEWVQKQAKKPHTVLRFDMSRIGQYSIAKDLNNSIVKSLEDFAFLHNLEVKHEKDCSRMLLRIIFYLYKKHGQVVILIDEYDKPILDNLDDANKCKSMREILRSFYLVLKSCDEYLRFVFLTGISKFSKIGVFSGLNNLFDLSMNARSGDIVGYTQEELELNFRDWLCATAESLSISKEHLLNKIKFYYDGFSFDGKKRLYNPFSILNFFTAGRFGNYWYISGSPTFIVNYMKKHAIQDPEEYRHREVSADFLDTYEIEKASLESFLYQSGYLTIENWIDDLIILDYPNEEVRKSILRMYLDEIYKVKKYVTLGTQIWNSLAERDLPITFRRVLRPPTLHSKLCCTGSCGHGMRSRNCEKRNTVVSLFNIALSAIPYDDFPNRNEFWYRSLFLMLIRGAGIISLAEVHTHKGRSDVVIQFENHIIVLEFKFAKTSSAIEQKRA